jgi:hypothetical protein
MRVSHVHLKRRHGLKELDGRRQQGKQMSDLDFEAWFLLAYTGYVVISLLALLWVGRDDTLHSRLRRQP